MAARSVPSQGTRALGFIQRCFSTSLLSVTLSRQQVQLRPLTRGWQEGALPRTFHLRKCRHFTGIFGSPSPSLRHVHCAGMGVRRAGIGWSSQSHTERAFTRNRHE